MKNKTAKKCAPLFQTLAVLFTATLFALCAGCGPRPIAPPDSISSGDASAVTPVSQFGSASPMNIPKERYKAALLLDTSGTMDKSDPTRQAFYAVNMFLDTLCIRDPDGNIIEGLPSMRVSVIPYNDTPLYGNTELFNIQDEGNVKNLKSIIQSFYVWDEDEYSGVAEELDPVLGQATDDVKYNFPANAGDGGLVDALALALDNFGIPSNAADSGFGISKEQYASSDEKSMIIIFTDGYTDYASAFDSAKKEQLQGQLDRAKKWSVEIYVIGLKSGEFMDASWPLYREMANATQINARAQTEEQAQTSVVLTDKVSGLFENLENPNEWGVNYWLVPDVVKAQMAYARLSAAMIPRASVIRPPETVPPDESNRAKKYSVNIKNTKSSALIFYMLSDSRLEHMELEHQDSENHSEKYDLDLCDKETGWNPEKTVRARWYKGYTTLSVLDPRPGKWSVSARGNAATFEARYILISGVRMELEAAQDKINPQECVIKLKAYCGELAVSDRDYYQRLAIEDYACRVRLHDFPGDGKNVSLKPSDDANEYALIGTFIADEPGVYRADFSVNFDDIHYVAPSMTFDMLPPVPESLRFTDKGDTQSYTPTLKGWNSNDIELRIVTENKSGLPVAECLTESGKQLLTIQLKSPNLLNLQSREKGAGTLKIMVQFTTKTAVDQQWEIQIPVVVGSDSNKDTMEMKKPHLVDKGHPPD